MAKMLILQAGCGERLVEGRGAKPVGIRRANVDYRVMDVGAAGRVNFRHLHPFAFGEIRGDDLVGVFDVALGRNSDGFRHGYDEIGLGNVPAFGPMWWWRGAVGIAGGSVSVGPG